jgi:hypothetical protein
VSVVQLLTVSLRTGCGRRIATAKGTRASKTLGDVVEHSLAELGYVEGRNVMFVHRYSGPEVKRLGDLASELVRVGVDIIVTSTTPAPSPP